MISINKKGKFMEKFRNLYSINKTLRFELKPYGKTLENYLNKSYLKDDMLKAKIRKDVQKLIDENFKLVTEKRLSKLKLDNRLVECVFLEDNKSKEMAKKDLKKSIIEIFSDKEFKDKYLKPKAHMKMLYDLHPENGEIREFNEFTTYFKNYFDIRKHIFVGENSGSIAYRIVDDNLHIYKNNIDKLKRMPQALIEQLVGFNKISELCDFNLYINQHGIKTYNEIIGGISYEDGSKLQGFNEKINLYSQKYNIKLPRLNPLYKMILSDRETSSFVLDVIDNDTQLIEMLDILFKNIKLSDNINYNSEQGIFVEYNQLGRLPGVSFSLINNLVYEEHDILFGTGKRKKSYDTDRKKAVETKKYSIDAINKLLKNTDIKIMENIIDRYKGLIINYEATKDNYYKTNWNEIENIKQMGNVRLIKEPLDALKEIQRFLNIFSFADEYKKPDSDFYYWLSTNINEFGNDFNHIYNKARNHLTKKQYSDEKIKLNFDSPTLASGWDLNKEIDNSAMIFRKFNQERNDYDYYLGIWDKNIKKDYKSIEKDNFGEFEKMEYKLYPDPSKMLPKQFMCTAWKKAYPISNKFEENYNKKRHTVNGDYFSEIFLHELIDRFKHGLINHENKYQEIFSFNFRDTKDYNSYQEFLKDVENQNYKVSFTNVNGIDDLVEEGKLYMFQIWSKDFSKYSKGTKNLNTIYFESLFSEENLRTNTFKLSGEAEVFYRKSSLKYDENIRAKGHHYDELKSKFDYPIIKDKRFSEDKFFFHVPVVINYRSNNLNPKGVNEIINTNINNSD